MNANEREYFFEITMLYMLWVRLKSFTENKRVIDMFLFAFISVHLRFVFIK